MNVILNTIGRARNSSAFLLYCTLLAVLSSSVIAESGSTNAFYLLMYAGALLVGYVIFYKLLSRPFASRPTEKHGERFIAIADPLADGLLIGCTIFIVLHFLYLGHIPLLAGVQSNDYFDIMRIRQSVFFEAPAIFRYVPNMLLKSVIPFLLLYYYVTGRQKQFWTAVVIGTFYGLSLLNKIFVVIPFVPMMLYLIFHRCFYALIGIFIVPIAALALLVFVQNPQVRPEIWTPHGKATASGKPLLAEATTIEAIAMGIKKAPKSADPTLTVIELLEAKTDIDSIDNRVLENLKRLYIRGARLFAGFSYSAFKFVETIYIRVFIIPGQVVSVWFSDIPDKLPFGSGCGYRLVADLRDCKFLFYPSLVHDIENPVLVAEGVHGTMTAASFMEDYANFGAKGLVLGGVLLAFVLALISHVFAEDWQWALILNFIPIAMMIELPLSTVMLTGGWALTLLLYPIFRARLKSAAGETAGQNLT